MTKLRLLTISTVALILINLGLFTTLFFGKPSQKGEGPKNIIIEKLHFDEAQVKAYETLISEHRRQVRKAEGEIMDAKAKLYETIADSASAQKDSLIQVIASTQANMENVHYQHFLDIKKLCKPDQIKYFNSLTKDLAQYFTPGNNKKRKE